jgi:tRNA uridine 5-carbamoylmethylation protein Kti12
MDREEIRPNITLMVGLPGSGKSTAVRHIMSNLNGREYIVLSPDEELLAMGEAEGLNYAESNRKYGFQKAEKIFMDQLKNALAARKNIIVDRTNLMIGIRDMLLRDVPVEYTKTAVICEVETEELQIRLADREKQTGKIIPQKLLTEMIAAYQPPDHPEFDYIKRVQFVSK